MSPSFFKTFLIFVFLLLLAIPAHVGAKVEWNIQNTLKTGEPPLDVAVAPNGSTIFVLTSSGNVLIYNSKGELEDSINVGTHIDQIRVGSSGDQLFATGRQNQTVDVIALNFIRKINISGSPFKGPTNAPIAVTVFSDFQ